MQSDDWYIFRTIPSFEDIAAQWIEKRLGGEVYYPIANATKIIKRPRVQQETVVTKSAAFPGYLLARFPSTPNWRLLDSCHSAAPALHRIVDGNGERVPATICDCDVHGIKAREIRGEFDKGDAKNPMIEKLVHSYVTIPSGSFMGHKGKIVSIVDGIVKIKVKLLGENTGFLSFGMENLFADQIATQD